MLAGDVQVTVDDGTLVITGDNNDNTVLIAGGAAGAVTISADDDTSFFFNGVEQSGPFVVGGFDSIIVDLNAGNDTLEMNNVATTDLVITMDEGADVVRLGAFEAYAANPGGITAASGSVGVDGFLSIDTGTGADLVEVVRVFGGADWDINLGDSDGTNNNNDAIPDNDFAVTLDDQLFIFIGSGDVIDINGGTGDDLVNINYLTSAEALIVDGVTGNDVISVNGSVFNNRVSLFGGSGFDTIAVDFSRQDGGDGSLIEIDGGSEDDFILFARSLVEEGDVVIRAGGGFDDVVIGRFYANAAGDLSTGGNVIGSMTLDTGGEGDFADIRGNDFDEFFGIFGGGSDDVDFINNLVRRDGFLDGGSEFDLLTFLGNGVNSFDIISFEGRNTTFDADAT
jgi:hypothetical protein